MLGRFKYGLEPIKKLPAFHHPGDVPIRTCEMNDEHLQLWEAYMQPEIDADKKRVDRGWIWPDLVKTKSYWAGLLGQSPAKFTCGVERWKDGVFIPIGMLLVVRKYPALYDHRKLSVFLWYMSGAPRTAIESHAGPELVPDKKKLGEFLIDLAITHSINRKLLGRLGLHAAPEKGTFLVDFYNGVGLINLHTNVPLPAGRGYLHWIKNQSNGNDGRYFYAHHGVALKYTRAFDKYR